jgi:hypothetical protein
MTVHESRGELWPKKTPDARERPRNNQTDTLRFYASAPAWMRDTQDLGPTETSLSTAATFIHVSSCEA